MSKWVSIRELTRLTTGWVEKNLTLSKVG